MRPLLAGVRVAACLAILAAAALSACVPAGGEIGLEASARDMPRLEAILAAVPLPEGWSASASSVKSVTIKLLAEDGIPAVAAGRNPRTEGAPAGALYLVPALPFADPRASLSRGDAEAAGLVPLESVLPPLRVPKVDGSWPGQPSWPFAIALRLEIESRAGHIPRALSAWFRAASEAAISARTGGAPPIVLGAVGDIQVGPLDGPSLLGGARGLSRLLGPPLPALLRAPDVLVGNLEGPVSSRGYPNPRKRFLFRFPPGTSRALRDAGFDLLLFANNHAFDYGEQAFGDSLADLESAALPWAGAGRNLAEAAAPRRLTSTGGQGLSFIGFARYPDERLGFTTAEAAAGEGRPGLNTDEDATVDRIRSEAADGVMVIVLAHGGAEYRALPAADVEARYRRFADAGAAVVLGSHPHVLQGLEARGDSIIAWSLGNFLFTGEREPPEAIRSGLLTLLCYRNRARGFDLYPLLAEYGGTRPDPAGAQALGLFSNLVAARETAARETAARETAAQDTASTTRSPKK